MKKMKFLSVFMISAVLLGGRADKRTGKNIRGNGNTGSIRKRVDGKTGCGSRWSNFNRRYI